jgi:hypothetical protein
LKTAASLDVGADHSINYVRQYDVAVVDVDETARRQSVAFEELTIVVQGGFIVGAAFEIVEDALRLAPLGENAVVFDVDRLGGRGELRQNPSARVGTSIRVGACELSAAVSACLRSLAVAARTPCTP